MEQNLVVFTQITTAFLLGGMLSSLIGVAIGSVFNASKKGRAW